MALHETLGKNLARLQASGGAIRAEDVKAGLSQPVADTGGDCSLGAEHDKIDLLAERALR